MLYRERPATVWRAKKPKLASQAGERLVNRLRREGKADEARDIASYLMTRKTDANH